MPRKKNRVFSREMKIDTVKRVLRAEHGCGGALLERKAVNAGVTVFVAVRTAQHNAQWLGRFAKAVASFPEVMDCYRMSGEIDYLIRLALPDIEAYDAFYKRLIAKVELSDVTSMFAMEEIKSTTRLPLNYLP